MAVISKVFSNKFAFRSCASKGDRQYREMKFSSSIDAHMSINENSPMENK